MSIVIFIVLSFIFIILVLNNLLLNPSKWRSFTLFPHFFMLKNLLSNPPISLSTQNHTENRICRLQKAHLQSHSLHMSHLRISSSNTTIQQEKQGWGEFRGPRSHRQNWVWFFWFLVYLIWILFGIVMYIIFFWCYLMLYLICQILEVCSQLQLLGDGFYWPSKFLV